MESGKSNKRKSIRVRILATVLIVLTILIMFFYPNVCVYSTFNYLGHRWGDFQYQGGWYMFDNEEEDVVWYVNPGLFQRDVVVPAVVKYKGQTYQVEGIDSRVAEYVNPKKNMLGAVAKAFLLRSFVISEGVTLLPHGILMWSKSVEYVEVPGTCKVLGNESFSLCNNLREVVLREGVEVIEQAAFAEAGRNGEVLKVELPDSVQYIGGAAFRGVELERLKLPADLIEIENNAFKYAFWREDSSKCTIPPKVTRIGDQGLGDTLTELIFEGTTPPDIQYDIPTVTKVTVPKGCLEIYQTTYDGKFNENVIYIEVE